MGCSQIEAASGGNNSYSVVSGKQEKFIIYRFIRIGKVILVIKWSVVHTHFHLNDSAVMLRMKCNTVFLP